MVNVRPCCRQMIRLLSCLLCSNATDTQEKTKHNAVFAFIVANCGKTLLRRSIPNVHPARRTIPTPIEMAEEIFEANLNRATSRWSMFEIMTRDYVPGENSWWKRTEAAHMVSVREEFSRLD